MTGKSSSTGDSIIVNVNLESTGLNDKQQQQQQLQSDENTSKSTENLIKNKNSNSNNGFLNQQEKIPRILRFLKWFHNWPAGARAIVHILMGCFVLLIPGMIDYFFFLDKNNSEGKSLFTLESSAKIGAYSLFSWSIYFSVMWAVLIGSDYLITILPAAVLRLINLLLGKYYVDVFRTRLDHIRILHFYMALIITTVVAIVFRAIAFPYEDKVFQQILTCALVISLLVFVEKFCLKLIATSFHRQAYADRLVKLKFMTHVIEVLYQAKKVIDRANRGDVSPTIKPWWNMLKKSGTGLVSSPIGSFRSDKSRSPSMSSFLLEKIRPGSAQQQSDRRKSKPDIEKTDGDQQQQPIEEIEMDAKQQQRPTTGDKIAGGSKAFFKESFNFVTTVTEATGMSAVYRQTKGAIVGVTKALVTGSTSDTDIQSIEQANWLATDIFKSFAGTMEEITVKHFLPFFPSEQEAQNAFDLIDKDKNEGINQEEMVSRFVEYYEDKVSLERGIHDLGATVGKLDTILLIAVSIIIILICLAVFDFDVSKYLVTAGSVLVAMSFIVGSSAKSVFESVVFIFGYHPYDVGDRVMIENFIYTVISIELSMTTFKRSDGQIVYMSNSVLLTKNIHNFRRSKEQSETISLGIPLYTKDSKIKELEKRMNEYVADNPRDYMQNCDILAEEIMDFEADLPRAKLILKITINHRSNWQDMIAKSRRRNKFMRHLFKSCRELKIYTKAKEIETDEFP